MYRPRRSAVTTALGLAASLCLVCGAGAGEAEHDAVALHVTTEEIVAAGKVEPVDGITSSGQPDAAALEIFAAAGYAAVIDLRTDSENRGLDERAAVESRGMEYVTLPVAGPAGVTFENAAKLDALIDRFDGPVLVHCRSGNRVGALLALRQSLKGDDNAAAIEYGKQGGLTRLEAVVRERLAEKP